MCFTIVGLVRALTETSRHSLESEVFISMDEKRAVLSSSCFAFLIASVEKHGVRLIPRMLLMRGSGVLSSTLISLKFLTYTSHLLGPGRSGSSGMILGPSQTL